MLHVLFYFIVLTLQVSSALAWEETVSLGEVFSSAKVQGTFVLNDSSTGSFVGFNRARAETRFSPASTFKIPNSIIGLETKAITSVDEAIPYTGPADPFIREWKRDMGLREAIKISNVPIYQELARRIGLARMREGVTKLNFGNMNIGESVDTFWLTGPLRISAVEQTQFLAQLALDKLPVSKSAQQAVREITYLESNNDAALYGKTGWQNAPNNGVGWWVGWVTKQQRIYAFALNIDISTPEDAPKRIQIGKACLEKLRVYP